MARSPPPCSIKNAHNLASLGAEIVGSSLLSSGINEASCVIVVSGLSLMMSNHRLAFNFGSEKNMGETLLVFGLSFVSEGVVNFLVLHFASISGVKLNSVLWQLDHPIAFVGMGSALLSGVFVVLGAFSVGANVFACNDFDVCSCGGAGDGVYGEFGEDVCGARGEGLNVTLSARFFEEIESADDELALGDKSKIEIFMISVGFCVAFAIVR